MMNASVQNPLWPESMETALKEHGYFILEGVLNAELLQTTKTAMREAQAAILHQVGAQRLARAGELGVLRLIMQVHPHFFSFLALPELLTIVDRTVGPTAILHLQNGFILPSSNYQHAPSAFQNRFHRDFPRYLNGYLASINLLFAIDEFTEESGATWAVPGSHQKAEIPDEQSLRSQAIPLLCPAGSLIVFDSTLWHAAGENHSGRDRYAMNHQFTRSYIKQQIDYVRALGEPALLTLPERSRQLLGDYTRVVTSLDEYYQPPEKRLYRSGQG
jgi:ectoine hydroxylase-related dioxygenase (phytanoyl-CoA dioxygenase family)